MNSTDQQTCECGCGAAVARRFLPGHDAKLKGALKRGLRSGDWRVRTASADALVELGWAHHADPADLRAVDYRDRRGARLVHLDEVEVWQVAPSGQHHSRRTCTRLTAEARANGAQNPTTKLAADRWLTFTRNTPETAARLRQSWDQCSACCTDRTRDEDAEAALFLRLTAALD